MMCACNTTPCGKEFEDGAEASQKGQGKSEKAGKDVTAGKDGKAGKDEKAGKDKKEDENPPPTVTLYFVRTIAGVYKTSAESWC